VQVIANVLGRLDRMHADHALNLASWNDLAMAHGQDAYYDSEALVTGASSLIEEEEADLAAAGCFEFAGLRVLHVQCHLGFDSITLARRGACVTGIDFSKVALA
jgi:2-polyprenyl-3-methyl-5-hydroxy-6-metoxy-1,4-benzoquinol methylase